MTGQRHCSWFKTTTREADRDTEEITPLVPPLPPTEVNHPATSAVTSSTSDSSPTRRRCDLSYTKPYTWDTERIVPLVPQL